MNNSHYVILFLMISLLSCETKQESNVNNDFVKQQVDNSFLQKVSFDSVEIIYSYAANRYTFQYNLEEEVSYFNTLYEGDYKRKVTKDSILTLMKYINELFIEKETIIVEKEKSEEHLEYDRIFLQVILYKNSEAISEYFDQIGESTYRIKYSEMFIDFFNLLSMISTGETIFNNKDVWID